MMIQRQGVKKLNDMMVDAQFAQQLGIKVFNKQATGAEVEELKVVADELITTINEWKGLMG
jgi:hypothetical protein